jgi:hypothetical protein
LKLNEGDAARYEATRLCERGGVAFVGIEEMP